MFYTLGFLFDSGPLALSEVSERGFVWTVLCEALLAKRNGWHVFGVYNI